MEVQSDQINMLATLLPTDLIKWADESAVKSKLAKTHKKTQK